MASAKTRPRLLLALAILLALAFLASGASKLANGQASGGMDFGQQFVTWGYPAWFRLVVGGAEVLFAASLLVPTTRFLGAAGLAATMLGAIVTHLRVDEAASIPLPLALGLLAGALAWAHRPERLPARAARPAAE